MVPATEILIVNNTGENLREFVPVFLEMVNGVPVSAEVGDLFSVKVLSEAWTLPNGKRGSTRVIVDWKDDQ